MNKATLQFAVTYGNTDFFDEEGLKTIFFATAEEVREAASEFIKVIPDDLEGYQEDIKKWDGNSNLVITHADDDTFLFSVTPIHVTVEEDISRMQAFLSFCKQFNAEVED